MNEILNAPITRGDVVFVAIVVLLALSIRSFWKSLASKETPEPARKRMLPNKELVAFSDFVLRNLRGQSFRGKDLKDVEMLIGKAINATLHQYSITILLPLPNINDHFDPIVNDVLESLIREGLVSKELAPQS